ncbi:MAG TPA: DUF1127 domain-containing protein [Azoarcus taiwanensis]|nr:DUF1127 domain-containing protein [Azoarcus taiwanensis]
METTQTYPDETPAARPGLMRRTVRSTIELSDFITRTVRNALRRRRTRRSLRAQREVLASLDDRTLQDIGLHRSEINSVVAELDGEHPTTRRRAHPDSVAPLY